MKKIIIIALVFIFFLAYRDAASQQRPHRGTSKIFAQANALYESKDYEGALREYQNILNSGLKSGNLYYDIGNTYMKKGDLGKAILNYTRALRYIPNDSDVLANLRHAKARMKQQAPVEKRNFIFRWLDRKVQPLTLNQILLIISFFYFLLIGYIILTRIFGKYANFSTFILAFICLGIILLVFPYTYRIKNLKEGAVAITPIGDVKYEPKESAPSNFTVYAGMKVYLLRTQGSWQKIKLTDGRIGWVPKGTVELIGM